jgi:hypothetical protein
MWIVGGLDIHRQQLTFDYVEQDTSRWERGCLVAAPSGQGTGVLRPPRYGDRDERDAAGSV